METIIFRNAECIKCSGIELEMILVGELMFCNRCFKSEFRIHRPLYEKFNSNVYNRWIDLINKKEQKNQSKYKYLQHGNHSRIL